MLSVGRQILTKRAGADDDVADADMEDITSLYKNTEGLARHQKQGDGCFNSLFSTTNTKMDRFNPIYNKGSLMADQSMSTPGFCGDRDRDRERDIVHYPGTGGSG